MDRTYASRPSWSAADDHQLLDRLVAPGAMRAVFQQGCPSARRTAGGGSP